MKKKNAAVKKIYPDGMHAVNVHSAHWTAPKTVDFGKASLGWMWARRAILVYAQAREACRRPKIAAAFCEPHSTHLKQKQTKK